MEYVMNPFMQETFFEYGLRVGILLVMGLLVMFLMHIKNPMKVFETSIWKKYYVWLIIVPILLVVTHSGSVPFRVFVCLIMAQCAYEYLRMVKLPRALSVAFWFDLAVTIAVAVAAPSYHTYLPFFYLLSIFIAASIHNHIDNLLRHVALSIAGLLWVGYSFVYLILIYEAENGVSLTVLLFSLVIVSDIAANLVGKTARKVGFGLRPLASEISPNKVRAGAFGNMVGAAVAFWMVGRDVGCSWMGTVAWIVAAGVASVYGDLAESIVKRCSGVKDTGTLIPNHGGLLDRTDSLIFATYITYVLLNNPLSSQLFPG